MRGEAMHAAVSFSEEGGVKNMITNNAIKSVRVPAPPPYASYH